MRVLGLLGLMLVAAAFAACILSTGAMNGLVFNSDLLLPAAFADMALHNPRAAALFQFPRIPSLVPDLIVYMGLFASVPAWRAVSLLYAGFGFAALVVTGGAVVAEVAGCGLLLGAATLLECGMLAILADLFLAKGQGAFMMILVPVIHGGAVLAGLWGLLLARRLVQGPARFGRAALFGLAAIGAFSDKLFVGGFLVPALAWWALSAWRARGWPAHTLSVVFGLSATGCGLGLLADRLLFGRMLSRQPDIDINLARQWSLLGPMLRDPSFLAMLAFAAMALLLPMAWPQERQAARLWRVAAAATVAGFAGLFPLVYADVSASRYCQPVWWWAIIALAAALMSLRQSGPRRRAMVGGMGFVVLLLTVLLTRPTSPALARVMQWHSPVEQCLSRYRREGLIHDGIAGYWTARLVEASSDWALHVDQISLDGRVLIWGNSRFTYSHLRDDPARRPTTDFLVMRQLDPAIMAAKFGPPDRVLTCPDVPGTPEVEVWLYGRPGWLRSLVGGMAAAEGRNGMLAEPTCLGAEQFLTASGPMTPAGVTAAADGPARPLMSWGPYLGLRRGRWVFELSYRLDGPSDASAWDVMAKVPPQSIIFGGLERTGGAPTSKTLVFDFGSDMPNLEFRSWVGAGDRLQIAHLSMHLEGEAAASCPE